MSEILLNVKNLKKYFKTNAGMLHAVDDVSFSIEQGHTMGVVGESGSSDVPAEIPFWKDLQYFSL